MIKVCVIAVTEGTCPEKMNLPVDKSNEVYEVFFSFIINYTKMKKTVLSSLFGVFSKT